MGWGVRIGIGMGLGARTERGTEAEGEEAVKHGVWGGEGAMDLQGERIWDTRFHWNSEDLTLVAKDRDSTRA